MQKANPKKEVRPRQQQRMPGIEGKMKPRPVAMKPESGRKLEGKVAVITGGDSGIGRAVALLFAKEGAHVAISYLSEHSDAEESGEAGRAADAVRLRSMRWLNAIVAAGRLAIGRL